MQPVSVAMAGVGSILQPRPLSSGAGRCRLGPGNRAQRPPAEGAGPRRPRPARGRGREAATRCLSPGLSRLNSAHGFLAGAKEIDIAATLEHLRDQRPGMVQTQVRPGLRAQGLGPRGGRRRHSAVPPAAGMSGPQTLGSWGRHHVSIERGQLAPHPGREPSDSAQSHSPLPHHSPGTGPRSVPGHTGVPRHP